MTDFFFVSVMLQLQRLSPGNCAQPMTVESQELTEDCLSILDGLCEDEVELETSKELASILCREKVEYLLAAHDKIAKRHTSSVLDGGGGGVMAAAQSTKYQCEVFASSDKCRLPVLVASYSRQ